MKAYAPHPENKTRTPETSSAPANRASIEEILQTYQTTTFEMPPMQRQKPEIQKEKTTPPRFDFLSPHPTEAPVLQRKAITLTKGLINGSEAENDEVFWADLKEKYKEDGFYQGLKELIQHLQPRWYRDELVGKGWERKILSTAVAKFMEDSKYTYFKPVSSSTSEQIKASFTPTESPQEEQTFIPQEPHLAGIAKELATYASGELKKSTQKDDPAVTDLTLYTNLLKRAVDIISQQYGLKIMYASLFVGADDSVLDNLRHVSIHHSGERWNAASDEDKKRAALAAIQWSMSNIPAIRQEVEKARRFHSASFHKVLATYSGHYFTHWPAYATMCNNLAKVRLTWGPITVGKDIYLDIPKSKLPLEHQWALLKTLIHETLHTIEHPHFTSFLATNVPVGLQSDLREGVTEYLTERIWKEVTLSLPTGGDTLSDLSKPLTVSATRKSTLPTLDKQYQLQVGIINTIIGILDKKEGNGDRRLEEAYFSGNIQAFLPSFVGPAPEEIDEEDYGGMEMDVEEEDSGIEEDMEGEDYGGMEKDMEEDK